MSLKTLKDIELRAANGMVSMNIVNSSKLKQAAIEWVKELDENKNPKCIPKGFEELALFHHNNQILLGARTFIKGFFNLKESDLK